MNAIPMTDKPCPRCLVLARERKIRPEMLQPLPAGAFAPRGHDGSGPCCFDCQAADTLLRTTPSVPGFVAARIATGSDREDQLRLPGAPMGLVLAGLLRPSQPGDLERHHEWLNANDWFGMLPPEDSEDGA